MEISGDVLKFLGEEDVQSALVRNDMQELYKLAVDGFMQGYLLAGHIGELTAILMQAGINPLLGMIEIPTYFLCMQVGIESFSVPQGITKINGSAFEYTDLESITIPNSVKVIGWFAFADCKLLKEIVIPESVEEMKQSTFLHCTNLQSAIIKGRITVLPQNCFDGCTNLIHIELPGTLEQIESYAFRNCTKLKEIKFAGTMEQWKNIKIDKYNSRTLSRRIVCSDGNIGNM